MINRPVRLFLIGIAALVGAALVGFVIRGLWNNVVVPTTGWHAVTYWQGLGLLLLAKIFFGFGGARSGGDWRYRMRRRLQRMRPEEREKFLEAMRARCGDARAAEPPL